MDRGPVVETTSGSVEGATTGGIHAFLGLPYAAAPVGPLRFAPSVRPARWDGARPATTPGPTAPQRALAVVPTAAVAGDDHLHVNVHTPSLGADGLPVLVWIHGGGWVIGSNADPVIDGARLASRGMVVVSCNYRLGVDGFLPLRDGPANRAVLDWLLALEWVHDNVGRFGGDPARVTVGGHSAGSAAALILTSLARADGLFRSTFAMSGLPWNIPSLDDAAVEADAFVRAVGAMRTAAGVAAVDRERLLEAQAEAAPLGGVTVGLPPLEQFHRTVTVPSWLGPVVDGDVIPDHPLDALVAGAGAGRPLMIGSTANELDVLMTLAGSDLTANQVRTALEAVGVTSDAADRWCTSGGRTPAEALGAALTQISFRAPVLQVAEARRGSTGRTFLYETTWQPPTPYGAVHGIDVALAFDNADAPGAALLAGGPPPQALADDFAGAVASFVADGDAGWTPYATDRTTLRLDTPSREVADADALVRDVFLQRAGRHAG